MATDYEAIKRSAKINDAALAELWSRICDTMQNEECAWIEGLRAKGIKAAHPNDGWVDRQTKRLMFAYPQFNDGAGVGDLVVLGWPNDAKHTVAVRLVRKVRRIFTEQWEFEYVEGVL